MAPTPLPSRTTSRAGSTRPSSRALITQPYPPTDSRRNRPSQNPTTEQAGAGVSGAGHVLPQTQGSSPSAYMQSLTQGQAASQDTNPLGSRPGYTQPPQLAQPQPVYSTPMPSTSTTQPLGRSSGTLTPQTYQKITEVDRLRETVADYKEDNRNLQNLLWDLQDKVKALEIQSTNPWPKPTPSPPTQTIPRSSRQLNKIKAALPEMYDGSTDKLEGWLRQMDNYFLLREADFQSEAAKVIVAFQHCRGGSAGRWADYHNDQFNKWRNGGQYVAQHVYSDWADFKTALQERFGDRYEQETAREKIDHARQGNRRVHQYIEEFLMWSYKAQYTDHMLCDRLIGGVNNELFSVVQRENNFPRHNLNNMIDALRRCEQIYVERYITAKQRELQQGKRTDRPFTQHNYYENTRKEQLHVRPPPQVPTHTKPERGGYTILQRPQGQSFNRPAPPPQQPPKRTEPQYVPMEVDRQRQQDQSKVKCYKCRQFGHYAKNCTVRINELRQEDIQEILQMHYAQPVEPIPEEEEKVDDLYPAESSGSSSSNIPESNYVTPNDTYYSLENTDQGFY